jgi:hypothetical protein
VKWSARPFSPRALARARAELAARPRPALPARFDSHEVVRALFVPEIEGGAKPDSEGPRIMTARDLL